MKKYFGTDGIRGKVNQGLINGEKFFKFGLAAGTYFANQNKTKQVAVIAKIPDYQAIPLSQHWSQGLLLQECMSLHSAQCQRMALP